MTRHWLGWMILLMSMLPSFADGQTPAIEEYQATVITHTRTRFRGTLENVTDSYISLYNHHRDQSANVLLSDVRRVVLRRRNRKSARTTGAVLGGLLTSYAAVRSLERDPPSNLLLYGVTVLFSAASGALAGLLVGSATGNLSNRVIRPLDGQPEVSLFRQLEPLTVTHQQNLMNRLPVTNP